MVFEITNNDFLLLEEAYKTRAIFHGLEHGKDHIIHVADYANRILDDLTITQEEIDVIKYSIMLHDSGRVSDKRDNIHNLVGARIANDFIQDYGIDVYSNWVSDIILRHTKNDSAQSMVEAIVRCCDRIDIVRYPNAIIDANLLEGYLAWKPILDYAIERRKHGALE